MNCQRCGAIAPPDDAGYDDILCPDCERDDLIDALEDYGGATCSELCDEETA